LGEAPGAVGHPLDFRDQLFERGGGVRVRGLVCRVWGSSGFGVRVWKMRFVGAQARSDFRSISQISCFGGGIRRFGVGG